MRFDGSIVFFGTEDLDRNSEFYQGLLKLKLYEDQGACRIYAVQGGGGLGFCSHLDVARKGRAPIITLLTEDVDGWHQHLRRFGLQADEPAFNEQFCIHHFFVRDPDGYLVEIQRFLR